MQSDSLCYCHEGTISEWLMSGWRYTRPWTRLSCSKNKSKNAVTHIMHNTFQLITLKEGPGLICFIKCKNPVNIVVMLLNPQTIILIRGNVCLRLWLLRDDWWFQTVVCSLCGHSNTHLALQLLFTSSVGWIWLFFTLRQGESVILWRGTESVFRHLWLWSLGLWW